MPASPNLFLRLLGGLRGNYLALLIALLVNLMVHPFQDAAIYLAPVVRATSVLASGIAMISVWHRRGGVYLTVVVGFAAEAFANAGETLARNDLRIAGGGLRALFFSLLILIIFGALMRAQRVNLNAIFGACSIYLLIAYAWASIYIVLDVIHPGSFSSALRPDGSWVETLGQMQRDTELLYFSIITLSTVGYGDVIPLSPPARIFSAIQGLIGPLYLAVIIARLISLEMAHRRRDAS